MKKPIQLISFLLLLIAVTACHSPQAAASGTASTASAAAPSQNNGDPIQEIRFESATRGYQKKVVFTPDSIFIVIQSVTIPNPKLKQALSPKEWKQLTGSLKGLSLDEISNLESPTNNRQTDAAKGSIISIYTSDNKQYQHQFDDTNPNAKLQPLMNMISSIENSRMAK